MEEQICTTESPGLDASAHRVSLVEDVSPSQGPSSDKTPWTQEYYNALRFYFWEPQWLNRHANATRDRSCDQVIDHVGRAEVSLNHLLSMFFSIASTRVVNRFLGEHLPQWPAERLESRVGPTLTPGYPEVCQPASCSSGRRAWSPWR